MNLLALLPLLNLKQQITLSKATTCYHVDSTNFSDK